MKKILMLLIALPFMAFAENVSKGTINYVDLSADGFSVDGWGASFDTAVNDNVLLQIDWFKLSEGGVSADFSVFSAGYAFGSLAEGSTFVGLARYDSDLADGADTDLEVGYAKVSGDGPDYTLSIVNSEDDLSFKAEVHTPSGISLGILTDGDVDLFNVGYHFRF